MILARPRALPIIRSAGGVIGIGEMTVHLAGTESPTVETTGMPIVILSGVGLAPVLKSATATAEGTMTVVTTGSVMEETVDAMITGESV